MHAPQPRAVAIAVLLATALGATACGGSGGSSGSRTQAKLNVGLSEYRITPRNASVRNTGTVTITLKNTGKLPHALAIEGLGSEARSATIQGGQSTTLTVDLAKKGTFTWYCPIDGHRRLGMQGTITVGRGSGGSQSAAQTSSSPSSGY
jgi:uncharacterized cupredoxin-like copper-binding protein